MHYFTLLISLVLYSWFALTACKSSETTTDERSLEEQLMSKITIDRFMALQEGFFVLYDSSLTRTSLLRSGDSLCLYNKQFGDPNKDGYWLYQKTYLSSVPDAPLSVEFLKISKISRDSFLAEQFDADPKFKAADQQPELLKEVNFKQVTGQGCNIIFEKIGQLAFKGKTPICDISYDGGGNHIFRNQISITMKGIRVVSENYKKEGDEKKFTHMSQSNFKKLR